MRILAAVSTLALAALPVAAAVKTRVVEYKQGDAILEGVLAWDDAAKGPRPGVLVVHDWMGPGAFSREKAEALAKMGYVAFAADIYGKGVRPKDGGEAAALAGRYKSDRALLRSRVGAAFDQLRANPAVDPNRIAAIGYCFGGTTVLELARSGAPLAGVVSFHGGLDSPSPADGKAIKGKVLVLHGADDPFNPPANVAAFQDEMRKAGVDWQFVAYGGAVHSFTMPAAGSDNSTGAAYNAAADRRSWQAMKDFFAEIFGAR